MAKAKVRTGMTQMKRNIQDKMSVIDTDTTLPCLLLINVHFRLVLRVLHN